MNQDTFWMDNETFDRYNHAKMKRYFADILKEIYSQSTVTNRENTEAIQNIFKKSSQDVVGKLTFFKKLQKIFLFLFF